MRAQIVACMRLIVIAVVVIERPALIWSAVGGWIALVGSAFLMRLVKIGISSVCFNRNYGG